ncbi:MAG: DUF3795 domain-containing protein [Eubacteriales bacterium]|nr:DUF3795 domain-containing protein [Eubacteriales bacterium]
MKNFCREDRSFSLCGLNCALCAMKLGGYCPGCGGGDGNQGCSIASCAMRRNLSSYCCDCEQYPCSKYDDVNQYDSFITHRNQRLDMERAQRDMEAYHEQLEQKALILQALLRDFNDGRRKSYFCLAVNLLDLQSLQAITERLKAQITAEMTLKERAAAAVKLLEEAAQRQGIVLKLRKKPTKKSGLI